MCPRSRTDNQQSRDLNPNSLTAAAHGLRTVDLGLSVITLKQADENTVVSQTAFWLDHCGRYQSGCVSFLNLVCITGRGVSFYSTS